MDAPCKGCSDRKVGCHGGCERYSIWTSEWRTEASKKRAWLNRMENRDEVLAEKSMNNIRYYGDYRTKGKYNCYKKCELKRKHR